MLRRGRKPWQKDPSEGDGVFFDEFSILGFVVQAILIVVAKRAASEGDAEAVYAIAMAAFSLLALLIARFWWTSRSLDLDDAVRAKNRRFFTFLWLALASGVVVLHVMCFG